jgi:hypothetical protein
MSYTSMFKAVFILAAAAAWFCTEDTMAAGLLILSGIFLLYQPAGARAKTYIEKTRYMERSNKTPRDPNE